MQRSIELRDICVICSVNCEVVDFIVTSQKAAIIGWVVVGEVDPLKVALVVHLKKFRGHLTHRITAIWMRKTSGISYFDGVPMIKAMSAVRIVIRQPDHFAASRRPGEGGAM